MPSYVQRKSANAPATTSVAVTLSPAATAGNYLIALMKENGPNAVTTPSGFSHTAGSPFVVGTRQFLSMVKVAAGGETTLTFSNADSNNKLLTVWEVPGLASATPIWSDGTTQSVGVTSKQLDTTGTLAATGNFFVAMADQAGDNGGEVSVDAGFTLVDTGTFSQWMIAEQITNATTALAPTFQWTTSRTSGGFMVGYQFAPVEIAFTRPITATITAAAENAKTIAADLDITVNRSADSTRIKAGAFTRPITASIVAAADATSPSVALTENNEEIPSVLVWADQGSGVWALVGEVTDYENLTIEPKFLAEGSWDMTVPDDEGERVSLLTPDKLYTVDWRGVRTTWAVDTWEPSSSNEGERVIHIGGPSALTILSWEQAWPDPSLGIGSQPDPGVLVNGGSGFSNAETIIRKLVQDNYITRRGGDPSLTLEANGNRGLDVRARGRFDSLLELVIKKAKVGEVGVDVQLVNTSSVRAQLRLKVWVPEDKSDRVELSEQLGSVSEWTQTNQAPTVTKAIVAGAGSTHQVVTTAESIAAADAWGGHRVQYVPLPDTYDADDQVQAGEEALKDGAAVTNVSLSATDAEGLMAFTHYNVGDKVTGLLESGLDVVDVITSIKVEISDGAPEISSTFGDPSATDPIFSMAQLIQNQDRRLRQVEQRS